MEEELNLDLSTEDQHQEDANRTEQRLRSLNSEKAKLTADKEELAKAKELAETERTAALKDVEFFKNFNTTASKYTGATDYQDKIREKVLAGYSMEDAMVSVLNSEGKFVPQAIPPLPKQSPVGGSATNTLKAGAEKSVAEMTQAERRIALMEAEARGEIGLT